MNECKDQGSFFFNCPHGQNLHNLSISHRSPYQLLHLALLEFLLNFSTISHHQWASKEAERKRTTTCSSVARTFSILWKEESLSEKHRSWSWVFFFQCDVNSAFLLQDFLHTASRIFHVFISATATRAINMADTEQGLRATGRLGLKFPDDRELASLGNSCTSWRLCLLKIAILTGSYAVSSRKTSSLAKCRFRYVACYGNESE